MFETKNTRPHVVVLGGGFGGLQAVRSLKHADVDITLIDHHTYNTFQPLLYQVATGTLNPGDITWFLRAVRSNQKNVRFLRGRVLSLDHDAQVVELDSDIKVKYDYLVIAAGVTANFFGIPGAEENTFPLYKRSHSLKLRDKIFACLEDSALNDGDKDVRIIVVGGGATGVETAGAIAEMRNFDMDTTYPEIPRDRVHVSLVEMAPHVLAPFHKDLRDYAAKALIKRGVDLHLNTSVKEVHEDRILVESDGVEEFYKSDIVIWASGISVDKQVANWGVPQGRGGRIEVDEHNRVRGFKNVFAIGDICIYSDNPLPQQAQPALQGGRHVGKVIAAMVNGQPDPLPFSYHDKGSMATIGRAAAIAEVKGFPKMKGFPAWIIWVAIHIATLVGNRNRFATLTNLTLKYLFWKSHNSIVGETPYAKSRHPKVIASHVSKD